MRIAVAFFGIPRSTAVCFPSIQKSILDALPSGADISCFYHLYEQREVINPRSGEAGILTAADYAPFVTNMAGILESPGDCLARWDYPQLKHYGDAWNDDFKSLRNLVHQLNSLHAVTELVDGYGPDFVVYARPDLYYHSPLPHYAFSFAEGWRGRAYVPSWQWWNGINDRFAVCGADAFRSYGYRAQDAAAFCRRGRALHGEELLRFALSKGRVSIRTLDTKATRVRTGGRFHEEQFSTLLSTGHTVSIQVLNCVSRVLTGWDQIAAARVRRSEKSQPQGEPA